MNKEQNRKFRIVSDGGWFWAEEYRPYKFLFWSDECWLYVDKTMKYTQAQTQDALEKHIRKGNTPKVILLYETFGDSYNVTNVFPDGSH